MASSEWSPKELRACNDSAEKESLGHDHHNHETEFTNTSSRHASFHLLPLYHTVSKSYSRHQAGVLDGRETSTSPQSFTLESRANPLTLIQALMSFRPPWKCPISLLFLPLSSSTTNLVICWPPSLSALPHWPWGGCVIKRADHCTTLLLHCSLHTALAPS